MFLFLIYFYNFPFLLLTKKDLIYNSAIAHYVMFYISFSSLEGVRVEVLDIPRHFYIFTLRKQKEKSKHYCFIILPSC